MNCHLPAKILLGLNTRTLDLLTKIYNERGFHSGLARTKHCFFFSLSLSCKNLKQRGYANSSAFNFDKLKLIFWMQMERERF